MTQKLADIEHKLVAPSRYAPSTDSALSDSNDEALTITPLDQDLRDGHSFAQAPFSTANSDLDLALCNSRVYLRTSHRHSISSIPSAFGSTCGWSFLSGISLAHISNISVISLPLCPHEIWNSHHYESLYQHDGLNGSDIGTSGNASVGSIARLAQELVIRHQIKYHGGLNGSDIGTSGNASVGPLARLAGEWLTRHPFVWKRDHRDDMIRRDEIISKDLEREYEASRKRAKILLLGESKWIQ